MNINSRFGNVDSIKTFLNTFNEGDWKAEDISPGKIQQFITNNIEVIANQQDRELHDQLIKLSDRISSEWKDPNANKLSFEVMGIAKGVFNESNEPWPKLPSDLWKEIIQNIPPRAPAIPNIADAKGGVRSWLETMHPSKELSDLSQAEERKWAGEELVSLKKYGCTTAKEAVQYAIENKLTGANLSEFQDLEESDLKQLFEACPNLDQLFIRSDKITTLPPEAKILKLLNCNSCRKLQSLGQLPEVQTLNCSGCEGLQGLPELPEVQTLNCSGCTNLQNLGQLSKVQTLYCEACTSLQSLGQLPEVQTLYCMDCGTLPSLPELPNVQTLNCSRCWSLQSLPELPKIQTLYCLGCNLQTLPELPNVQMLDCSWCGNLQTLPKLPKVQQLHCNLCNSLQSLGELPKVQTLYCTRCESLQGLGELPQVQMLYCSWCESLQSIGQLTKVQVLDCRGCKSLQSLPVMPEGAKVIR